MTADRPEDYEEIVSRARAAFIGLAIGDALGGPGGIHDRRRDRGEVRRS